MTKAKWIWENFPQVFISIIFGSVALMLCYALFENLVHHEWRQASGDALCVLLCPVAVFLLCKYIALMNYLEKRFFGWLNKKAGIEG